MKRQYNPGPPLPASRQYSRQNMSSLPKRFLVFLLVVFIVSILLLAIASLSYKAPTDAVTLELVETGSAGCIELGGRTICYSYSFGRSVPVTPEYELELNPDT